MAYRGQPIDDDAAAFERINRRLRDMEDALTNRLLPPGYVFNIVGGDLVVTRQADGATATLVFS